MNIVWSFGDSMTAPLNGAPTDRGPYRMWLGRDAKDTATFVADEYGFKPSNMGVAGSSNSGIFHKFISQLKNIQSGDILIFGWTVIARYRIAAIADVSIRRAGWKTIWAKGLSNVPEQGCIDGTYITKEVAEQLIYNRCDIQSLYEEEVNEWIYFINDWAKLKAVKVIHWSWCNKNIGGKQNLNLSFPVVNYTDMSKETDMVVRDGHYGEVGYRELANDILKYLNK